MDIESEKFLGGAKIAKCVVISELIDNSINFMLMFCFDEAIIDVNSDGNAFVIWLKNSFISIWLCESEGNNFGFDVIRP